MDFILNLAIEKNIIYDDTFRTTMGKWMKRELNPQANENSREKLYRLCFILGLTYKETIVFFKKYVLSEVTFSKLKNSGKIKDEELRKTIILL